MRRGQPWYCPRRGNTPRRDQRAARAAGHRTTRTGSGIVVSEDDFRAMKREIEELARRNVHGGTSPTLERLIAEAEAEGRVVRRTPRV